MRAPSSLRQQTLLLLAAGLTAFLVADLAAVRGAYRLLQHARWEEHALEVMAAADALSEELTRTTAVARTYEASGDRGERREAERGTVALQNLLGQLAMLVSDQPALVPLVAEIQTALQDRIDDLRDALATRGDPGRPEARAGTLPPANAAVQERLGRLRIAQRRQLEQDNGTDRDVANATLIGLASLGTLAMIVALLTGLFLNRSVGQPVTRLLAALRQMEQGDLGFTPLTRGPQEFLDLAQGAERMARARLAALAEVNEGVAAKEALLSASRQLSERLVQLAQADAELLRSLTTDRVQLLQEIADRARELSQADLVGVGKGIDPAQPFSPWVLSGASDETRSSIALQPPVPAGLAEAIRTNRPVHWPSAGTTDPPPAVPPGHPTIGAFLAFPLHREAKVVGTLYLIRQPGRPRFSPDEQRVMELFTLQAEVALEKHRLYVEARQAARSREEVMAVVSHDLKAPLNAVLLAAHALSRVRENPERFADTLRIIRSSVGNMTALIDDLLHASAIEAGRFRIQMVPTDLRALTEGVVEMFAASAAQRSLKLVLEFPPDRLTLPADTERLRQVLSNLLGNALKFTPAHGAVRMTVSQRPAETLVQVCDDGPGIPPDDLDHVFDRFWRARTARQEGTGLGLYIARGIVEAHGGRIWAESVLGQGTVFSFVLPRGDAAELPESPPISSASPSTAEPLSSKAAAAS